ncbi:MAG: hypothetical protein KC643_20710 [Nitrospira sp.]|nr:hypothetical protein [Nitrospira sp.]
MVKRRGRRSWINDEDLVAVMRTVLTRATPASFHGEAYRKVWARLRHQGSERIRTGSDDGWGNTTCWLPCEGDRLTALGCMTAGLSRWRQI